MYCTYVHRNPVCLIQNSQYLTFSWGWQPDSLLQAHRRSRWSLKNINTKSLTFIKNRWSLINIKTKNNKNFSILRKEPRSYYAIQISVPEWFYLCALSQLRFRAHRNVSPVRYTNVNDIVGETCKSVNV